MSVTSSTSSNSIAISIGYISFKILYIAFLSSAIKLFIKASQKAFVSCQSYEQLNEKGII